MIPPIATLTDLHLRHHTLLIDAYGVIIHQEGPIAGAIDWINHLNITQKPYFILTNDASRSPKRAAANYQRKGLQISPERIITAGSLLAPHFAAHQLVGSACVVLGTEDSAEYVRQAGGVVVSPFDTDHVDVIAICDDHGFPFLETIDATMSLLFRRIERGLHTHLLLPNPDLMYQKNAHNYGFTSGSIALLLEAALQLRYPALDARFLALGKPHPPIFERAATLANTRDLLMIGDQIRTDIVGALRFGIPCALVGTGLSRIDDPSLFTEYSPTYLLPDLSLPASPPHPALSASPYDTR